MDSVAIQTQALRETQAVAIADQQRLDEESLQRLKEEDAKAKVCLKIVALTKGYSVSLHIDKAKPAEAKARPLCL